MQLIKFFFGIVVVQIATILLIAPYIDNFDKIDRVQLGVPFVLIALVVALWFRTLVEYSRKDAEDKIKEKYLKEREKLKVNAEKAKTKVVKEAQKDIAHEAKVTHAKANFKVGLAFASVIGVGGLFVVAQMFTVGLLLLSAGGGAIGGYYIRNRQLPKESYRENPKIIETKPKKSKLPFNHY
ncbi:MAG: hypothetical protein U9N49_12600 [Campylobacterota bacterium]|nr:hypothetical protein [Campylobacterota bacterium]